MNVYANILQSHTSLYVLLAACSGGAAPRTWGGRGRGTGHTLSPRWAVIGQLAPVLISDWSRCRPGCGAPWRASSSRTAAPRRTTPASRTRRTTSSSTPTPPTMPSTRCVNVIKVEKYNLLTCKSNGNYFLKAWKKHFFCHVNVGLFRRFGLRKLELYRMSTKNILSWKNSHNYPQTNPKCKSCGCFENSGYLVADGALTF